MKRSTIFLTGILAAGVLVKVGWAESVASGSIQPAASIILPVFYGSTALGNVACQVQPDTSSTKANASQLLALLRSVLIEDAIHELEVSTKPDLFVDIGSINIAGVKVEYDGLNVRLAVTISDDKQKPKTLALSGRGSNTTVTLRPSDFSASLTLNASQAFDHSNGNGFGAFAVASDATISHSGAAGALLRAGFRYDENYSTPWIRGTVSLSHDDVSRALRYSIGDTALQHGPSLTAQSRLGGISVERLYSDIQPSKNIHASGSNTLRLETASEVEVYVNGALVKSLRLQPGFYSLTDFPLSSSQNDLLLVVTNSAGEKEEFSFSAFSHVDLLGEGISRFGFSAGYPHHIDDGQIEYGEHLQASAYGQYGISDWLTVGASVQASDQFRSLAGQLAAGTFVGLISSEVAVTQSDALDDGFAFRLNYKFEDRFFENIRITLDASYFLQSSGYLTLDRTGLMSAPSVPALDEEISARLSVYLPWQANLSFNSRFSQFRSAAEDRRVLGISYTQGWGPLNLSAGYEHLQFDGISEDEQRFFATLTYRLTTPGSYVRSTFDSQQLNRSAVEYIHTGPEQVDALNYRVGLARTDDIYAATGNLEYSGNHFLLGVDHNLVAEEGTIDVTQAVTRYRAGATLGYADGVFAVGRPAPRAFAIVDTHPSMADGEVDVNPSKVDKRIVAETDWLGPALVPIRQSYLSTTLYLSAENTPPGYNIGEGQFTLEAPLGSGTLVTVGSNAYVTITGTLYDANGQPRSLLSGELVRTDGGTQLSIPFFTNKAGRLIATNVSPGKYKLDLTPLSDEPIFVEVPEGSAAYLDLGIIR